MKHPEIKIGFLMAFFALFTFGAIAQTGPSLPNTSNPPQAEDWREFIDTGTYDETIDSVTVGSRMPYRVDPQTAIPGLTFEYKWLFASPRTIQDYDGNNLSGDGDYYAANEISVLMPTTTGDITITTNVRTLMGTNALCEGTDVTNLIRVVPRPTIKWAANQVVTGCAAQEVTIQLSALTGNSQFEVKYEIDYYENYDKSGSKSSSSGYIVLTGTSLTFPATTFPDNGVYEIQVTNITDRISRKSLVAIDSIPSDLPTTPYQVVIYPTPVTKPLQHIRNMPE